MKFSSLFKSRALMASCLFMLSGWCSVSWATDLPSGVLNYLRQKDHHVQVRFDGLVLFSNGESYVPIMPQDPELKTDVQQVIATFPEKAAYPDLIQFDNNFFLMRLVQTSSGRLTLPKMAEYPIQLKEGLLPQDFVLPNNLYIPVELKVILGALPYNPSYTPSTDPVIVPAAMALQQEGLALSSIRPLERQAYVYDLAEQKILLVDLLTGRKQNEVVFNGVPAAMVVSSDGKLLFLPSLSSSELVVVDTGSNLVKTRIPVGEKPDAALLLPESNELVISHRYSPFLSVIRLSELVANQKIDLPSNGGVMAKLPRVGTNPPGVIVADSVKPQLYWVNMASGRVERTMSALPDISAVKVLPNAQGHLEIWVASRTKNQVWVLDESGNVLKKLDVGKKTVAMLPFDGKMFVLSAGDSRLDVINTTDKAVMNSIDLIADSFPSDMVIIPSEKRAYITLAASTDLLVVALDTMHLDLTTPVSFRASMLATAPEETPADAAESIGTSVGVGTPGSAGSGSASSNETTMMTGAVKTPSGRPNEAEADTAKKARAEQSAPNVVKKGWKRLQETVVNSIKTDDDTGTTPAHAATSSTTAGSTGTSTAATDVSKGIANTSAMDGLNAQGLRGTANGKVRLNLGWPGSNARKHPANGEGAEAADSTELPVKSGVRLDNPMLMPALSQPAASSGSEQPSMRLLDDADDKRLPDSGGHSSSDTTTSPAMLDDSVR